jgi:hypothetical protein
LLSIHSTTEDNDDSDFNCVVVVVIGLDDDGTALGELILLSEFEFELEAADPTAFVLLNTDRTLNTLSQFWSWLHQQSLTWMRKLTLMMCLADVKLVHQIYRM